MGPWSLFTSGSMAPGSKACGSPDSGLFGLGDTAGSSPGFVVGIPSAEAWGLPSPTNAIGIVSREQFGIGSG
jgi:hypothetical protein